MENADQHKHVSAASPQNPHPLHTKVICQDQKPCESLAVRKRVFSAYVVLSFDRGLWTDRHEQTTPTPDFDQ